VKSSLVIKTKKTVIIFFYFLKQIFGSIPKNLKDFSQPLICNKGGEWKVVVVQPSQLKYAKALEMLKGGQVFDANFVKAAIASCSSKPTMMCQQVVVDWSKLTHYTG